MSGSFTARLPLIDEHTESHFPVAPPPPVATDAANLGRGVSDGNASWTAFSGGGNGGMSRTTEASATPGGGDGSLFSARASVPGTATGSAPSSTSSAATAATSNGGGTGTHLQQLHCHQGPGWLNSGRGGGGARSDRLEAGGLSVTSITSIRTSDSIRFATGLGTDSALATPLATLGSTVVTPAAAGDELPMPVYAAARGLSVVQEEEAEAGEAPAESSAGGAATAVSAPAQRRSTADAEAQAGAGAGGAGAAGAAAADPDSSPADASPGAAATLLAATDSALGLPTSRKWKFRDASVRIDVLGQGASGTVYKMVHVPTLTLVAAKMIPIFDAEKRHSMINEFKALYTNFTNFSPLAASAPRQARQLALAATPAAAGGAGGAGASSRASITGDAASGSPPAGVGSTLGGAASTGAGATATSAAAALAAASAAEHELGRAPCPYIVSFYDAFVNANEGTLAFVMEYMDGGSLEDIVATGGCQRESVLANICCQVLKGLQFLHDNRIVHRDLKPSNMLINHSGDVKITDFGIVREMDSTVDLAHTFVGTQSYMSPERIAGESYSYQSDVWSFGLTMLAVAVGRYPIDCPGGASFWGLLNYLQEESVPLPPEGVFSPAFRDFIAQCLHKDPSELLAVVNRRRETWQREDNARCFGVQRALSAAGEQLSLLRGASREFYCSFLCIHQNWTLSLSLSLTIADDRPLPAALLLHPWLARAKTALEAQERSRDAAAAAGLPPPGSSGPAGSGKAGGHATGEDGKPLAGTLEDLKEIVRKVQKYRYWSALKRGDRRLALIPEM
jgi:serine/threonine protein kinase